jgi:hypothetical protein
MRTMMHGDIRERDRDR